MKKIVITLVMLFLLYLGTFLIDQSSEDDFIFEKPFVSWFNFGTKDFYYEKDYFFDEIFNEAQYTFDYFNNAITINKINNGQSVETCYSEVNKDSSVVKIIIDDSIQIVEKRFNDDNKVIIKNIALFNNHELIGSININYFFYNQLLIKKNFFFIMKEKKDSILIAKEEFIYNKNGEINIIKSKISNSVSYNEDYISLIKDHTYGKSYDYDEYEIVFDSDSLNTKKINVKTNNEIKEKFFIFNKIDKEMIINSYNNRMNKIGSLVFNEEKNIIKTDNPFESCNQTIKYNEHNSFEKDLHCESNFDNILNHKTIYKNGKIYQDSMVKENKWIPGFYYSKWIINKSWKYDNLNRLTKFIYTEKLFQKDFPYILSYKEQPMYEINKEMLIEYSETTTPRKISTTEYHKSLSGEVKNENIYLFSQPLKTK